MRRFFVRPEHVRGEELLLVGEEARHAFEVLRLGPGAKALAFDGAGREYVFEVTSASSKALAGRILEVREGKGILPLSLTLVQGVPKGRKMDLIVRMGTEAGIDTFIPVVTRRTVVRFEEKASSKVLRWQRIAREAAKQSQRTTVPSVLSVCTLEEALWQVDSSDLILMPWEGERQRTLGEVLARNRQARQVVILIGPEGGFEPGEVREAVTHGAVTVSLGPLVYRTETAGVVTAAMVIYELVLRPFP
ncbi:MAG: RsmE family RNA methyltransferase [Armatimonadota bacterium]|nr:RsmE family RNA methyltransferase [Armatimonadota bacterium]MDR5702146.1 RsmE family RNA methyltransferase [Armatimonadota bacterium]